MKTIDSFILPEILEIDFFYEFKLFLAKKKDAPDWAGTRISLVR